MVAAVAGALTTARGAGPPKADLKAEFLHLCDAACEDLDAGGVQHGPPLHPPRFYIDSYAIRGLMVAYDMTGNPRYLRTCRRWSDRMLEYQSRMTPKGAYYMCYGRKPGEDKGDWYVADSASIAMGVLATAVRCSDSKDRQRYLSSVKSFAKLVIDNYVGPGGGITDGIWSQFDGEWWCSSGLFGSLAFLLYNETGDETYRKVGLDALDWLIRMDFSKAEHVSFQEAAPTVLMYVFEAYSAGMPQLQPGSERREAAMQQWAKAFEWMAAHQQGRAAARPRNDAPAKPKSWADYNSQWGCKFGGLPFHMYVYAQHVPGTADLRAAADQELHYIAGVLWKNGNPRFTQLAGFAMMSFAEKLSPGAMYRTSKQPVRVSFADEPEYRYEHSPPPFVASL